MPTPMNVPKPAHIPGFGIEASAPLRATARRSLLPGVLVANLAAGLGLVALLPGGASAAAPSTGLIANVTTALSGAVIHPGDLIASGWAISMPAPHAAATVSITGITASIPLTCRTWGSTSSTTVVLHLPNASRSFAANDPAWYPTAAPAAAQGYQLAQAVTAVCANGLLTPGGAVSYAAKLVSTDTADLVAMRFHSVDPNALRLPWAAQPPAGQFGGGDSHTAWSPAGHDADATVQPHASSAFGSPGTNTNCASAAQNSSGVSQCNGPWTPTATAHAAAPAGTTGSGSGSGTTPGTGSGSGSTSGSGSGSGSTSGTGSGSGKGSGTGTGTGSGVSAGPVAGTGTGSGSNGHVGAPPPPAPAGSSVAGTTVHPRAGTVGVSISSRTLGVSSSVGVTHSVQSGGTGSAGAVNGAAVPLPAVASPTAPSNQGHVLGPVPLVAPSIGASIAQVGAQLPWNWFGVLAAVDLSLMAGILLRRRARRPDSIYAVSASTDGLDPTAFDQED